MRNKPKAPTKSKVSKPARGSGKNLSGKTQKTNTFYRQNNESTKTSTTRGKLKPAKDSGVIKAKAAAVKTAPTSRTKESSLSSQPAKVSTNLASLQKTSDINKRKPKASF
jgi:hypothetical protein